MKDMKGWQPEYMQSFMLSAGKYGCYALQIIGIAHKCGVKINDMYALVRGIQEGYIDFNPDNYEDSSNFFVRHPDDFLSLLTKEKWTMQREGAAYKAKPGEYVINFWAKNDVNNAKGEGHFDASDYHTLQHSYTIEQGKVYSKRVFKRG